MDSSTIKVESKEIVDNAESQLSDSNVGNNKSSPPHTGSSRKSMSSRHSRNSRGSLRSSEITAMFKQIRDDMSEMRENYAKSQERLVGYIQGMEARSVRDLAKIEDKITVLQRDVAANQADIITMRTQQTSYRHNNDRVVLWQRQIQRIGLRRQ